MEMLDIALLKNNAHVGAQIAVSLAHLRRNIINGERFFSLSSFFYCFKTMMHLCIHSEVSLRKHDLQIAMNCQQTY